MSKSNTLVLFPVCDSQVTFAYKHKVQQINDTDKKCD